MYELKGCEGKIFWIVRKDVVEIGPEAFLRLRNSYGMTVPVMQSFAHDISVYVAALQ